MTHETPPPEHARYRPNVGVVVFNTAGLVWLGRRRGAAPPRNWQFPQGGVDPGEDLLEAARRELREETGITSVSLLARAEGWITYEFPSDAHGSKVARGYQGQTQAWFAFRFDGEDTEIDLQADPHPEFDTWRWATLEDAGDLIVPFNRDAYAKVIAAFQGLAIAAGGMAER
jgi:putative (di)nucleoside polyphosphate hydrolase